jgi:MFS family permease
MERGNPDPVVPRTVKGLGLVSLFNDFASELVYPLLPAFITRSLGGSAVALGALDGAADLTSAVLRWVSGRLADRPGWKKPLILVGYGSAVLARPLIAITSTAWQVIGFRVLDRVGKGLRSPARDALVARVTPPGQHGRAFGFHRMADHLGAVIGSILAWVLLTRSVSVRDVIGFSAVPGLVAVLVLMVVLRGVEDNAPSGAKQRKETPRDAQGWSFWGPTLALAFLTVGRLPEMLLLLRLQDLGVTVIAIPLVWAGLHVVRTAGAYPGGWLSDLLGPRLTLALAGLLFTLCLLLLSTALAPLPAIGAFLALGLVTGLTEGAERAAVARLAPVLTGRGFGNVQGVTGVAALPAALAFGWIYDGLGGSVALAVSSMVVLLGVGVWWWAAGLISAAAGPPVSAGG